MKPATSSTIANTIAGTIASTIPVLPSLNLNETLDFYTCRLGFSRLALYDNYAIVARDGAEIHFWPCNERHICENSSCYMRVNGTEALYQEFESAGVPVKAPTVQPWGMKELYVIDPHGNLLKFGEEVA